VIRVRVARIGGFIPALERIVALYWPLPEGHCYLWSNRRRVDLKPTIDSVKS
jgi:hypothetical protein